MNPREPTINHNDLMSIGAAIFHGKVETMDSAGNYSGTAFKDQTFANALTMRPYGFRSYAPQNTGLVLTYSQAGLIVLSQENALPSGVSEPQSGEALLYNSQGAQVKLDTNGDIIILQKSARFVNMGSSPEFVALASKVDAELSSIETNLLEHKHGGVTTGSGTSAISDSTYEASSVAATEVKAT